MTNFRKTENIINFPDVFCRGAALHEIADQDTCQDRLLRGALTCLGGMHGEIHCHFISLVGNFY